MRLQSWLLLAFPFAVGCGKGNFSEQIRAGNKDVLRQQLQVEPTSLDPAKVQDIYTGELLQNIYEPLTVVGEDNKVHPQLAERWDVLDGGKTYVFHLRKGVKFSNGKALDGDDVKWSIERACSPKLASPTAESYLSSIVGVKERVAGADHISGIEVIDPQTVRFRLIGPRGYFLGQMSYLVTSILPKGSVPLDRPIESPAEAIGTGPYVLKSYSRNQEVVLAPNPSYYAGAPRVTVERLIIKDNTAALAKYRAGELDMDLAQRADVASIKRDSVLSKQLIMWPRASVGYLPMIPDNYPPFRKKQVRQAFAMAIDRKHICNDLLDGIYIPANGILPSGMPGHRERTAILPFDPKRAQELLAGAGYPGGRGLPSLQITFSQSNADSRLVADAAASDLRHNLGVDASTRAMDWTALLDLRNKHKLPMLAVIWIADYMDPQDFLSILFSSGSHSNWLSYRNPDVDRLCAAADGSTNETERMRLYAKAEDLILNDAPWITLYFGREAELISPRVRGVQENLLGHMPFKQATVR